MEGPSAPLIPADIPLDALYPLTTARWRARRAAEIRASVERGAPLAVLRSVPVLPQLETGECERGPSFPTLPARTDQPVADDPAHPAGEAGVVAADTDREYRAAMEHTRKDRLARWQTVGTRGTP